MSRIQLTHGLTETESQFVTDNWLADTEPEYLFDRIMHDPYLSQTEKMQKALAVRTRYCELDMIYISQELAARFLGEENEND